MTLPPADPIPPTCDRPRPRRRRFRPGLRGLMLLIALIALPIGWKARRAATHRRAVAAVGRLGGRIEYDWQAEPKPGAPTPTGPAAPGWARRWLGDEYFQEVVRVDLIGSLGRLGIPRISLDSSNEKNVNFIHESTEERWQACVLDQLACLDGLDRIESLEVVFDVLGADALDRIGRLGRLRKLSLFLEQVDNSWTPHLARVRNPRGPDSEEEWSGEAWTTGTTSPDPSRRDAVDLSGLDGLALLEELFLQEMPIDDAGLARLADRHPRLTTLSIDGPRITEAGLAHLAGLRSLADLSIGAAITDAGLAHLGRVRSLTVLRIDGPRITEAGLAHLAGLDRLDELDLTGSPLSGPALRQVGAIRSLRYLRISKEAADPAELRAARPDLTISVQ